MKRKFTVSIALAMVLVLVATVAAFAIGLTNSKGYTNLQKVRNAIAEKYNFNTEMIKLLMNKNSLEGDEQRHFEFHAVDSMFMDGKAFGVYTVEIDDKGNATATWSYDDVDPATWADGDLTSPVWGAPQLEGMLERYRIYNQWEQDTVDRRNSSHEESVKCYEELEVLIAPIKCPFDYRMTDEEHWAALTPSPIYSIDEGSEEYVELAKQALLDQYGVTQDTLVLFAIDTELVAGSWEITAIAQAHEQDRQEYVDQRWSHHLSDRLGTYTVLIDAKSKEIQSVKWSHDDIDLSQYDETNWGAADAYSPRMLVWAMDFIKSNKPITDKYSYENNDWFSIEDEAAYDEAFRNVGFTNSLYSHDLPKEGDVTYEQALQIAIEAIKAEYKLTDEQIATTEPRPEYLVKNGVSTWDVIFWSSESMGFVSLDAADGVVLYVTLDSGASSNG